MAPDATTPQLLPPALAAIKEEEIAKSVPPPEDAGIATAAEIEEEGRDLRVAAEQSLNVILDLTLDGIVRWASPSWQEVVGTPPESISGKPISDLLVDDKNAFAEALDAMKTNDTGSRFIQFAVQMGPKSVLWSDEEETQHNENDETNKDDQPRESSAGRVLDLEAQGILVYDRTTGGESHSMWMIRPWVQREVTIDLPRVLVESLGEGAEMLASYLTSVAEFGTKDPENHPPPLPVLCRICERHITPWWFPKHTELCLQEHTAEAELQRAQENLSDHRHAIVKVLDSLEAQNHYKSANAADRPATEPAQPEYKGMPIGPTSLPSSGNASGRNTPSPSPSGSRERAASGLSHVRARSFAVRRPLSRIVELILDLCDTALEISQPALKDIRGPDGELRTQSPQSEGRISQVLQWQSPSAGALENEAGLAALCDDSIAMAKTKIEAIMRHRHILEYAERIRSEFTALVQDCIDAAMQKAAKIAAGESSGDSAEEGSMRGELTDDELPVQEMESMSRVESTSPTDSKHEETISIHQPTPTSATTSDQALYSSTFDGPAMASVYRRSPNRSPSPVTSLPRRESSAMSTRSSSPKACPTPKSSISGQGSIPFPLPSESDAGADSDTSARSSVRSHHQAGSPPIPEPNLTRMGSTRDRKRTSLVLPRSTSLSRQHSPGRVNGPPGSPLSVNKPRLPSNTGDPSRSPMMSPVLPSSEFHSPTLPAQAVSSHRRQSSAASSEISRIAQSPRLSLTNVAQPRPMPPSIRDFEIIKPISKGAFGSVYLAKKKSTGDYFAIKALKKTDMVAKNQVANVKAERAILMWQGESDFVAKLYWTFPSKDYIFLVMEYLNGGDCASLVHALGTLPEDWAKRYLAEVVQGVEHLHSREIVHRDLKPDNLLIDQKGHLKLTDFGLSRMGLIGRQKRALTAKPSAVAQDPLKQGPFGRSSSMGSSRSASFDVHAASSPGLTPSLTPFLPTDAGQPSYFTLSKESSDPKDQQRQSSMSQHSEGGDSDQLSEGLHRLSLYDEPWVTRHSPKEESGKDGDSVEGSSLHTTDSSSSMPKHSTPPQQSSMGPPPMALFDPEDNNRRFVGTPDYLAPETINGLGQDEMSDWWSLGCIMFEFLFGYPPFHAETQEQVFDNILSRKIDWPEDDGEVTQEAKDLMNRLMCLDPSQRLGANIGEKYSSGGEEIRRHSWFADIEWDTLNESEASFVPAPANPEDTEYFDPRGATLQNFSTEFDDQSSSPALTPNADFERPHDALTKVRTQVNSMKRGLMPLHIPPHVRDSRNRRLSEPVAADDFGQFSFKNLPVLEKANKDVIQKLRAEAMQAQSRSAVPPSSASMTTSTPSLEGSPVIGTTIKRALSTNTRGNRSSSPSGPGQGHLNASPGRASQPPSPLVQFSTGYHERRKTSGGMQPSGFFDAPRLATNLKNTSNASSPVKSIKSPTGSLDKTSSNAPGDSPRARSRTLGVSDSGERMSNHQKRRSQVFDVSPSSSDTEDPRQKALLRVQRRRQSSRRLSQINFADGPMFRPLDVLVCEDHPVSRIVMEKLLEKLRCRAIILANGTEAMRYAMGSVKFDIIMMESKLPQINGADVARMIRETKNSNCHTPIVAVTGYLKELQAPHHFDALIEKPPTLPKLTEVMSRLCQWKSPPPGDTHMPPPAMPPSGLRKASLPIDDSPISNSSGFAPMTDSSYQSSSREDSISSTGYFTDVDARSDDVPFINEEHTQMPPTFTIEGLGISSNVSKRPHSIGLPGGVGTLQHHDSAPAALEPHGSRKRPTGDEIDTKRTAFGKEQGEFGDDEDEELGDARARSRSPRAKLAGNSKPTSNLSVEMLRTNSQGSVISNADSGVSTLVPSPPSLADDVVFQDNYQTATTPPEFFLLQPGESVAEIKNLDPNITSQPMDVHTPPSVHPEDAANVDTNATPQARKPRSLLAETMSDVGSADTDVTPQPPRFQRLTADALQAFDADKTPQPPKVYTMTDEEAPDINTANTNVVSSLPKVLVEPASGIEAPDVNEATIPSQDAQFTSSAQESHTQYV